MVAHPVDTIVDVVLVVEVDMVVLLLRPLLLR